MAILPALSCSRADGYWPQPHFNTGGMTTDIGWRPQSTSFFSEKQSIYSTASLDLVS